MVIVLIQGYVSALRRTKKGQKDDYQDQNAVHSGKMRKKRALFSTKPTRSQQGSVNFLIFRIFIN